MGCCNQKGGKTGRELYIKLRNVRIGIKDKAENKECKLELTGGLSVKQVERVPKLELQNSPLYRRRIIKVF